LGEGETGAMSRTGEKPGGEDQQEDRGDCSEVVGF